MEIVTVDRNPLKLEAFQRLLREYQAELPEDLRVPNLEGEIAGLLERYGEGVLLLALRDAEPVGCVVLRRLSDRDAELKRLYVAPEARGTGAGRSLTEAAVAAARQRGYRRVVLDTHRGRLQAAYSLYRSMGFVECEAYAEAEYTCPTFMELVLR